MIKIVEATETHLLELVPLFNNYRVFYKMTPDMAAAQEFLYQRLSKKESTVFLAYYNGEACGFTQLYFTFSSVSLQPSLILNDLYVNPSYRKKGIGKELLMVAKDYCRKNGYKGLALETAIDNPAQELYERLGWKKDSHCFHYFWTCPD